MCPTCWVCFKAFLKINSIITVSLKLDMKLNWHLCRLQHHSNVIPLAPGLTDDAPIIHMCKAADRHHHLSSTWVPVPQRGDGSGTTDSEAADLLSVCLSAPLGLLSFNTIAWQFRMSRPCCESLISGKSKPNGEASLPLSAQLINSEHSKHE